MTTEERDNDGFAVRAGDTISFSFGIPPRQVQGILFEREGQLVMPTPDVTPKEATLQMLRKHVGGFWKVFSAGHPETCLYCMGSGESVADQVCPACYGTSAE